MYKNENGAIRLAMCNFIEDVEVLRNFALEHGFGGIDWSFDMADIPETFSEQAGWLERIKKLEPLEVRYHCPFSRLDIGHEDPFEQKRAMEIFRRIIDLVSKAGGRYLTIHVGLGRDSTRMLSWEGTIHRLNDLVRYGSKRNVLLCLENLAWGWTAKPNLFEKLIRLSGAWVTLDIGHARACEAVHTQQYECEDFAAPHMNRICNAHVYHDEIEGLGHIPPENVTDIENRLDVLSDADCRWWTLEIREKEGLIKTRRVVEGYLEGAALQMAAVQKH
ncbi:MAG: sugar phosphate isomerase/epimerase family protein [Thermodesulfobacteriota bacterium]